MKTMLSRHFRSSIYIHKLFGGFWNLQSLLGLTSSQNRAVSSIHTSQSARFNLFRIFLIFNFGQFLCMMSGDKTPMTKFHCQRPSYKKYPKNPNILTSNTEFSDISYIWRFFNRIQSTFVYSSQFCSTCFPIIDCYWQAPKRLKHR